MYYPGLFEWWIASITFNILFVIAASVYLYARRQQRGSEGLTGRAKVVRVVKDFAFVWIMLGLLLFYIYSVGIGSALIFGVGNIVVEILLVLYTLRNSDPKGQN
jgi:phosphatidylglycerophosphate synthase